MGKVTITIDDDLHMGAKLGKLNGNDIVPDNVLVACAILTLWDNNDEFMDIINKRIKEIGEEHK